MPRRPNSSKQTRIVLATLLATPKHWWHGYDLSQETELKSGTLYPILMRLKEQGLLISEWREPSQQGRPPRHVYRLSATGSALARTQQTEANKAASVTKPRGRLA